MQLANSPLQSINFAGREIYLKRDDLLHPQFSGNKARKLDYFLVNDWPQVTKIVGHGSVQANSLYSLAALAKLKNWQFDFYVTRIPHWLKANPIGNYAAALALGANIIEVDLAVGTNLDNYIRRQVSTFTAEIMFIPEGGRSPLAKTGVAKLADELIEQSQQLGLKQPLIMLPSGTGTTALFLQLTFIARGLDYRVLTCACVAGTDYLQQQFTELEPDSSLWPQILVSPKKYQFGKLYPEFYQIWQQLLTETGVEFELLYDPLGWLTLIDYVTDYEPESYIIYIHQGGLLGNSSMLPRYKRKYR